MSKSGENEMTRKESADAAAFVKDFMRENRYETVVSSNIPTQGFLLLLSNARLGEEHFVAHARHKWVAENQAIDRVNVAPVRAEFSVDAFAVDATFKLVYSDRSMVEFTVRNDGRLIAIETTYGLDRNMPIWVVLQKMMSEFGVATTGMRLTS